MSSSSGRYAKGSRVGVGGPPSKALIAARYADGERLIGMLFAAPAAATAPAAVPAAASAEAQQHLASPQLSPRSSSDSEEKQPLTARLATHQAQFVSASAVERNQLSLF